MVPVAKPVTTAEVQIPRDASSAITFMFEEHALRIALLDRKNIPKGLDPDVWQKPGIYVLLGPVGGTRSTRVYVGKTGGGKQGVRGRLGTQNTSKKKTVAFPWKRVVAVVRDTSDGFDSSQVGYLEGRVASELDAVPGINVSADRTDQDNSLSESRRENLDSLVTSILAALSVAGLPLREDPPEGATVKRPSKKAGTRKTFTISLVQLVSGGYLPAGEPLFYGRKGKVAQAKVTGDGTLIVKRVAYKSVSEAARVAFDLKHAPNGWTAWCRTDESGESLADLRKKYIDDHPEAPSA